MYEIQPLDDKPVFNNSLQSDQSEARVYFDGLMNTDAAES